MIGYRLERGFRLKLDVQGQGGREILNVDGQSGWGSQKLDNFHERQVCIIPYAGISF